MTAGQPGWAVSAGVTMLRVGFNGHRVDIECGTASLAGEVRKRVEHVTTPVEAGREPVLRITITEVAPSWFEVRDSKGRCECASFEPACHHLCQSVSAALVDASAGYLWLHASAAARDGVAVVLLGPAGAGKSTLLVELMGLAWNVLADDAVAIERESGVVLPLPFTPSVRTAERRPAEDHQAFLTRHKSLVVIPVPRVATTASVVGALVFPEYVPGGPGAADCSPMTVVSAVQALARQHSTPGRATREVVDDLWCLAGRAPTYRLRYRDPAAAARLVASLPRLTRCDVSPGRTLV